MKKRISNQIRRGKWLLLLVLLQLTGCGIKKDETAPTPSPIETPNISQSPAPTEQAKNGGQATATTQIFDRIPERTKNVELAIGAINGAVLSPNEIFSFNETVGDRTEEKGYQKAVGFDENGEKQPTVGGGVCQVSSTLYMAALNGDFEIVERHSHSHEVPYADADHDATVSYGGYDFKFQNNRDKPIKISAETDGKSVTVTITEN